MGFGDLTSAMQRVGLDNGSNKNKGDADRGLGSKLMEAGMKYASGKPQQGGGGQSHGGQNQGYVGGGAADSYYNPQGEDLSTFLEATRPS
jgi:hypothetical protein